MNRATSAPSRRTAIPTTMARLASEVVPPATAWPTPFIWAASSRLWCAIQMLCQASITTASDRMAALNSSCPTPSKAPASVWMKAARRHAPRTPAAMPAPIQSPREAMPRVAAAVIPTIRPASMTSRKTMMAVPSMVLLCDEHALGGRLVEFTEEFIPAALQRPQANGRFAVAGNHLFDTQRLALELLGRGIEVFHLERDRLCGRDPGPGRLVGVG